MSLTSFLYSTLPGSSAPVEVESSSDGSYAVIDGFSPSGLTVQGAGTTWLVELTVGCVENSDDHSIWVRIAVSGGSYTEQPLAEGGGRGNSDLDHHCLVARNLFSIESDDSNAYTFGAYWRTSGGTATILQMAGGDAPSAVLTATLVGMTKS